VAQPRRKNLLKLRSKFRWFRQKGPASAGLFFILSGTLQGGSIRLPPVAEQYFRNFTAAFAPLVIKQEKRKLNYRWGDKNRDCAGLIRYIFWEALQRHDDRFFGAYPEMQAIHPPDLADLQRAALVWTQKNFTATQLIQHSRFLGRHSGRLELKTGDLFYFSSPELKIRHVMLVIRGASETYLVYHTGDARNELRIRTVSDLMLLPETEWHPDPANPVFQGMYRPDFLN